MINNKYDDFVFKPNEDSPVFRFEPKTDEKTIEIKTVEQVLLYSILNNIHLIKNKNKLIDIGINLFGEDEYKKMFDTMVENIRLIEKLGK